MDILRAVSSNIQVKVVLIVLSVIIAMYYEIYVVGECMLNYILFHSIAIIT